MMLTACHKKSADQINPATLPGHVTDLGAVALVPGVPTPFSLPGGKSCVLTGRKTPDGLEVKCEIASTNADGSIEHFRMNIITAPGQPCAVVDGGQGISLTPTLKTP